jgi:hydrogenase maturation protease
MTRALIAGIGNVFFGDAGFGIEVARRLAAEPPDRLPAGTAVADVGIRSIDLAFDLLEPLELVVIAECMPRGGPAGTLYVTEADLDAPGDAPPAHGLDLATVFAVVRALGGHVPPVVIVGCEPADAAVHLGLSPPVSSAIEFAVELVRALVVQRLTGAPPS